MRLVDGSDVVDPDQLDDAERRLRMYAYLTAKEAGRTYFAIMRVFFSTLMADLSAADVASALASLERDGGLSLASPR